MRQPLKVYKCDGDYANADGTGDDHDNYVDDDESRSGVHDDEHRDQHDNGNGDVQYDNQCNGDMRTDDYGGSDHASANNTGDDHDNYVGGDVEDNGNGQCNGDRGDDHNDRGDY